MRLVNGQAGRGVPLLRVDRPTSYSRQRDKLRDELTFAKIDHHAEAPAPTGLTRAAEYVLRTSNRLKGTTFQLLGAVREC